MQYVTVSLKVDNTSSQDFSGYWGDYLRLKSGTITSPPNDATLSLGFVAHSTGGTGGVTFAMPSGSTSYTLIFLSTPSYPNGSTVKFQTDDCENVSFWERMLESSMASASSDS